MVVIVVVAVVVNVTVVPVTVVVGQQGPDEHARSERNHRCPVRALLLDHDGLYRLLDDREDLLEDERFSNDHRRYENRHLIRPIVSDWVANHTASQAIQLLEEERVP